ncbi:MAG: hypothetical protein II624_03890, partial [Prevotella sp.]|nr:hypothetical protein [Prevotella sp.]
VLYLFGEVTGVEEITAPTSDENAPIYDVMGRRVLNPQPGGIYIQNGKKPPPCQFEENCQCTC